MPANGASRVRSATAAWASVNAALERAVSAAGSLGGGCRSVSRAPRGRELGACLAQRRPSPDHFRVGGATCRTRGRPVPRRIGGVDRRARLVHTRVGDRDLGGCLPRRRLGLAGLCLGGRDGRLGLGDLGIEARGVEAQQRLSGGHRVAFLDQHLGHHAATGGGCQLGMTDGHGSRVGRDRVGLGDRSQRRGG